MNERRGGQRHVVAFPIRVAWQDENGQDVFEDGLTENIGPDGTLVYLPRKLPSVGAKVKITVNENVSAPVTVNAEVIRLERNAAHPQAALNLLDGKGNWKKKVWEYAGDAVAGLEPEEFDDW
jgi:hypothetical protein